MGFQVGRLQNPTSSTSTTLTDSGASFTSLMTVSWIWVKPVVVALSKVEENYQ